MKLKILAFGIAREILNGTSIEVEVDSVSNAGELKSFLEKKFPKLTELNSFMIAVNEEYANDNTHISATDEVAIIPPVSGG